MIVSKDFAAIGANDCDYEYISQQFVWPRALRLRPSTKVPADQLQRFGGAADEADRLRSEGKGVSASASFAGRVRLDEAGDLPGEFTFHSIDDLTVEALPDAADRWPVSLNYAGPAYYSSSIAPLTRVKQPSTPPKGFEAFRGRQNVVKSATYVGRLRMRDKYVAVCRDGDDYITNGFGHLNGAAAEIVVEEIRDVELSRASTNERVDEERSCQPPNLSVLCQAATLSRAASLGCMARVAELLSKQGIDSSNGNESDALNEAIRTGNTDLVKALLNAGAPVNPSKFSNWPPLGEAAWWRKLDVMKTLLRAGANVDALDHQGATYLVGYGFFDPSVLKISWMQVLIPMPATGRDRLP